MTEAPILSSPDYSLPYTIYTDASMVAGAAVLTQIQNGEEKVIAYHSAKFSRTQQNYSATERECLAVLMGIEKFRPFIDGVSVRVITDHASLKWLQNLKEPHGKLARWAVRLQAFNIQFEHRAGKLMALPDALSRSVPIDVIDIEQRTETEDPWYNNVYALAMTGKLHRYKMVEDRLYHLGSFEAKTGNRRWCLCIPRERIPEVMKEQHDSAHFGYWKTIRSIQRMYYWPNMHQTVNEYVKNCAECKVLKPSNEATRVKTGQYFDPKGKGRVISLDLIGPLPASKVHKHMWIIVAIDVYTRYTFVKGCTKATANVIADFLEKEIFYKFDTPEIIITDNGTQFVSQFFKAFLKEHKIRQILTPVYHPQSNPVEATNKSIKQLLRTELLPRAEQTDWSSFLQKCVMQLNTTPRMPTGQSPHFLVFGKEKSQNGLEHRLINDVNTELQSDNATDEGEKFELIYETVAEEQRAAFERNRKQYDLRASNRSFPLNSEVLIKNNVQSSAADQFTRKLAPNRKRVYVKEKVGENSYRLVDSHGKEQGIYHANQIYAR